MASARYSHIEGVNPSFYFRKQVLTSSIRGSTSISSVQANKNRQSGSFVFEELDFYKKELYIL